MRSYVFSYVSFNNEDCWTFRPKFIGSDKATFVFNRNRTYYLTCGLDSSIGFYLTLESALLALHDLDDSFLLGGAWEFVETDDVILPVDEFNDCVTSGGFIDYDGYGELATLYRKSHIHVKPSTFDIMKLPDWATHVVWYNK